MSISFTAAVFSFVDSDQAYLFCNVQLCQKEDKNCTVNDCNKQNDPRIVRREAIVKVDIVFKLDHIRLVM